MMATRAGSNRVAALLGTAALWVGGAAVAAPATLEVGELSLTLCNQDYTGYCGSIKRPLDPGGAIPGTIEVGFEYYPRADLAHASLGTILPQEGGPGYSSTGTRDYYLSLFAALRDRREVLIIDKRGTGLSGPIDCPAMQTGATDLGAVAACATQLGNTAWFYGTDFAVNDIVAVMDALQIDDVDFYGDSYGTFVGQVLAGLHPHRLRSIILDSAYPVRPPDPWFASDWAAAWSGIDLSCARSPSCRELGGRATSRMQRVIEDIRQQPIQGVAPDGNGVLQPTRVDIAALILLIDSAGFGPPIYRDLDAAARAWLDARDPLPLLRLVAEVNTGGVDPPEAFSYGLYEAVTCTDYPLLYDMTAPRVAREREYAAALERARQHRPGLFAPFTDDEGIESRVYITPLDSCLPWPKPPTDLAPGAPGNPLPASARYPAVPTLVLSGDLDSITSVADAAETTAQFPNAVHVVVPNLGHVVGESDEIGCTLAIIDRFVRDRSPGSTDCVKRIRPVRTVLEFARNAAQLAPLTSVPGDKTTDAQRRLAAAGLEAVGDAIARYYVTYNAVDSGLRGGTMTYQASATGYRFRLSQWRWTEDVAVSGSVLWDQTSNVISANVRLESAGKTVGRLDIRWNDAAIDAVATVSGAIQGKVLNAQRLAP